MRAGKLGKLLRMGVVGMLLASLPAYGLAAAGLTRSCADATQTSHSGVHDAGMHEAGMHDAGMHHAGNHDCCPEAPSSSPDQQLPGKSGSCTGCLAAGHSCKSTQGMQLVQAVILHVAPTLTMSFSDASPHASLCGPDGFLRPPDIS
jgi:hypothetical protein